MRLHRSQKERPCTPSTRAGPGKTRSRLARALGRVGNGRSRQGLDLHLRQDVSVRTVTPKNLADAESGGTPPTFHARPAPPHWTARMRAPSMNRASPASYPALKFDEALAARWATTAGSGAARPGQDAPVHADRRPRLAREPTPTGTRNTASPPPGLAGHLLSNSNRYRSSAPTARPVDRHPSVKTSPEHPRYT